LIKRFCLSVANIAYLDSFPTIGMKERDILRTYINYIIRLTFTSRLILF